MFNILLRACSSLSIITFLPEILARPQAIALLNRQPTMECVNCCVSSQTSENMFRIKTIVTLLSLTRISTASAISKSCVRSLGSFFCASTMSSVAKEHPSSSSKIFDKAKPGGVNVMPVLFSVKRLTCFILSAVGNSCAGVAGTNIRLDSAFPKFFGGNNGVICEASAYKIFGKSLCSFLFVGNCFS